ncbi:putative cp2 transcription factor [Golovinomyces cichoracearum]|uniref:Putative cp2 transcription factor n=1 Tax=Golovinomyces cichoracearum TaxID=62708 RepID=A0A420IAN3_9PEZI|nr:putative cp2 transcription factor [Golovinomyces cichoracearum]
MFRNRTSSLKPGVDFIANFRQTFPEVSTAVSPDSSSGNTTLGSVLIEAPNLERHQSLGSESVKDFESTPRAQHEPWRFTPSLLDPNSFGFSPFASQPPGYYSPTPGSSSSQWQNQTIDVHTPGVNMSIGLQTPLSLSTSADTLPGGPLLDMAAFNNQLQPQFPNYNPFSHHSPEQQHQQNSFAPSSFLQHQESGFEVLDHQGSPIDDDVCLQNIDGNLQQHQSVISYKQTPFHLLGMVSMPSLAENFRFHVTLSAPTAMIKHPDEIPITYLNKGQAYSLLIVDTAPTMPQPIGTRYRTFVRISFEDEQQRQRPSTCWQLWKEGRGTNEAHLRGGKLQAVEYVESSQQSEIEEKRARVELDTASFDGFSVIWTPGTNGLAECSISVRFNFLSTDFSHSKGVKGIPVRLCAKTQTLPTGSPHANSEFSEVAYCKVKLFRDHGAERKLSNDVAHVKKTIDKLNQQIVQSESGMKDFGKRKRTGSSSVKSHPNQRPGKVHKHKRTWSMSSASSSGGRMLVEDDLIHKLKTMNDMFSSQRLVSILYLRGSEQDDPDLYPVALAGEPTDLTKVDSRGNVLWQQRSCDRGSTGRNSSLVSLSPIGTSLQSQAICRPSQTNSRGNWADFNQITHGELQSSNPQHLASPPDQLTKIAKADGTGNHNGWIEALGVDPSYKAPLEQNDKPVACFYIALQDPNQPDKHEYYRAIYLTQRTLQEFNNCVATKWNLDPTKIIRTLRILERGLQVEVDDDIIIGLAEGQDLIMEIATIELAIKDEDTKGSSNRTYSEGLEIRIMF